MNNELIDEIARKYSGMGGIEDYRSFAKDIAAAEREECAKMCDALCDDDNEFGHNECDGGAEAAARIRMRSNV